MIINEGNLDLVFRGFKTAFNKFFEQTETHYRDVAMTVPSSAGEETYGWLGQFPDIREWIGDRVINNLKAHSYTIENKLYENTVSVPRVSIEDDKFGVFAPIFQEMGRTTAEHPDKLTFSLLKNGFTEIGFDGQFFFDADHPVGTQEGPEVSVSNFQAGAEAPWFLLDTSRAVKPLIHQERSDFQLTRLDRDGDENVFFKDEYIYGVRGRSNVGFGLWQLAYASKAELNAANYEAARQAMMSLKGDHGRPLGIKPNVLVVDPTLEGKAMRLLNRGQRVEEVTIGPDTTPVAVTNEWEGTADLIITPFLS